MVCPLGQGGRGVEQVRTFFGQGEGVNFSWFSADVFYGRPLILEVEGAGPASIFTKICFSTISSLEARR